MHAREVIIKKEVYSLFIQSDATAAADADAADHRLLLLMTTDDPLTSKKESHLQKVKGSPTTDTTRSCPVEVLRQLQTSTCLPDCLPRPGANCA